MLKRLLTGAAALALMTACSPSTDTPKSGAEITHVQESPNEAVDAWFEARFQEALTRSPMSQTYLGIKDDYDKWDDLSPEFAAEDHARDQAELAEFKAMFDRDSLDDQRKLSYDIYVYSTERSINGYKWRDHSYPFNQMFGTQSGIPAFMINQHRVSSESDMEAYIARLNGVNEYLGQAVENSKRRSDSGINPPKFVYDHVLRDAQNIIVGAPFDDGDDSPLMADARKKVDALEVSDEAKADYLARVETALTSSVGPAYSALVAEMKRQEASATSEDGAWKLPQGDDYYAYRLKMITTTDMSATEIHDLGLSEVERIHAEMREIMQEVGFNGTLQDFFEYMRNDPDGKFTYEDSDKGRDAYLSDATDMIDTMKAELDSVFIKKPKADLTVKRVEAFREKSAGKAFYQRPAADGSRPGIYYANLYKITDMPSYQMEALAYHEGIPGHHMQLAIQQELEAIPSFRKYGGFTAYTEGWGLYSEYLPKEMGFYEDPYSDFGRLAMELWRAARLVVDTGLHDKKWTREEAIDYLTTNTPNPENDCIKAIERYIVMPGQATAYKIGMIKILDLREAAKAELGDKFDIREFHDAVLANGAVPLDILEQLVDEWVAEKKAG